ncbi:hypothetical protein ANSO36C_14270 [Nostoc cf. commune SO-36]|uniref:DUF433 domain-containing protein n=1 Tax=Nostoc cf. commune SO-36 TaxID=449208 RepID=A0ABM7YY83_NOSCO|nr:DUF433 domain-containing protein [Nostoc commune]BDI15625.1 hypothetical protein ANSO36C_14270 [Nostoc cf. commune SO-36]
MLLIPTVTSIPLVTDANGVVRVSKTRITLDTVVTAFLEGATAEEIREQYPSLHLWDIYFVIGYYLEHQAEVDAYLRERQRLAAEVQQEAEKCFNPIGVRDSPFSKTQPTRVNYDATFLG